jgi:hypothetical protein
MDRKLNLSVNQKVVIRRINGSIRYLEDKSIDNIDAWITVGIVEKITKKYVQVNMNGKVEKFDIELNYAQKVNRGESDYRLYESKEELINEVKSEDIYSGIRNYFYNKYNNDRDLTLDQLQRINAIIEE